MTDQPTSLADQLATQFEKLPKLPENPHEQHPGPDSLRALLWPHPTGHSDEAGSEPEVEDASEEVPDLNPETWSGASPLHPDPARRSAHLLAEGHPAGWLLGAAGHAGARDQPMPHLVWVDAWAEVKAEASQKTQGERAPLTVDHECCGCGVSGCGGFWGHWHEVSLEAAQRAALAHPLDLDALSPALREAAAAITETRSQGASAYLRGELRSNGAHLTVWMPRWAADPGSWDLRAEAQQSLLGQGDASPAAHELAELLTRSGHLAIHRQPRVTQDEHLQGHRHPEPGAHRAESHRRLSARLGDYLGWQARWYTRPRFRPEDTQSISEQNT